MHGGTVEVTSDGLGKGSEFTVRLPILQASDIVPEEANGAPSKKRSFPCHRILIVDDIWPAALVLGTLLRSRGQEVRTATSGASPDDDRAGKAGVNPVGHLHARDERLRTRPGDSAATRVERHLFGRRDRLRSRKRQDGGEGSGLQRPSGQTDQYKKSRMPVVSVSLGESLIGSTAT